MRGEHVASSLSDAKSSGSSPHARGTLNNRGLQPLQRRLIPACAGNTPRASPGVSSPGAHPRMRGEHTTLYDSEALTPGSSPHARGTRLVWRCGGARGGLIPACAGNTGGGGDGCINVAGSSPHARGTLGPAGRSRTAQRLIPACAGNTVNQPLELTQFWAHPRMRGEHDASTVIDVASSGSSPHARGTLHPARHRRYLVGLIPACAGNTTTRFIACRTRWAHPRMRGEHCVIVFSQVASLGSSPHARGTHDAVVVGWTVHGLIPACAGNTQVAEAVHLAVGAHPRMRGEHYGYTVNGGGEGGSSPHARGTLPCY